MLGRIISEFEAIRERALTKPEDTREMIDMLKFVEESKTKTLIKLHSDIKVNKNAFNTMQLYSFMLQFQSFMCQNLIANLTLACNTM